MSERWTMDRVIRHESRLKRPGTGPSVAADSVEREIEGLHYPIIAECKRRGWKYVHSNPVKRATNGEGVVDFIIYADGGRVFNIECKSKTGKLDPEQLIFIHWITKLGHVAHVITAMSEFRAIVDVPHETNSVN